jgi:hypothetical protein
MATFSVPQSEHQVNSSSTHTVTASYQIMFYSEFIIDFLSRLTPGTLGRVSLSTPKTQEV